MADEQDMPGFKPPHPGEYLRHDILPALGMSITELADRLGVTRPTLSAFVNGKSDLSLEMAQRLGQAFRNGTRFWMTLQMQRDIWIAERNKTISVPPIVEREGNAA